MLTYCVVPRDLAPSLHELLRRHFADQPAVEVIVEKRARDRRASLDRRRGEEPVGEERRRIRAETGRRVADRRALTAASQLRALPRRARAVADRIVFVERFEPVGERAEDIDTARLVSRIQAGETRLFSELYMRYFDRVYTYLRVVMRDAHEAEDGAQQVFTQVLEALPNYERRADRPFRAWLFIIVRNYAIYQLRKHSRMEPVDPAELRVSEPALSGAEPDIGALNWITDRELMMFVERLPLAQRQVLVLRFMLDLSHREIAVVLDRSPEDVRILHHRALAFLRARLRAIGREPERDAVRERSRAYLRQRTVLRARRFALHM